MAQPNLAEHIDVFLQSIAGQRRSNQSPTDTTSSAAFQEDVEPSREERGSPPNSHLSPETQDTFHHLAICTRNAPKDDQRDSKHTLKSRNKRKCQRKKQQIKNRVNGTNILPNSEREQEVAGQAQLEEQTCQINRRRPKIRCCFGPLKGKKGPHLPPTHPSIRINRTSSHMWEVSSHCLPIDELHDLEAQQSSLSPMPDRVTFRSPIRNSPFDHYKLRKALSQEVNTHAHSCRKLGITEEELKSLNNEDIDALLRDSEKTQPSTHPPAQHSEGAPTCDRRGSSPFNVKSRNKRKCYRKKPPEESRIESCAQPPQVRNSFSEWQHLTRYPWLGASSSYTPTEELHAFELEQTSLAPLPDRVTLTPPSPTRHSPFDRYWRRNSSDTNPYEYSCRKLGISEEELKAHLNADVDALLKNFEEHPPPAPHTASTQSGVQPPSATHRNKGKDHKSTQLEDRVEGGDPSVEKNIPLKALSFAEWHNLTRTPWRDASSFHLPVDELFELEKEQTLLPPPPSFRSGHP